MKNTHDTPDIITLEDFMPYRLSVLSNKVSTIIAATYEGKFGISVTEWRIMAVLGEYPDASADFVSVKTQIEKSIISRAIAKLLQRKLIEREFDADDRRRSVLNLSETGRDVYREIVPVSFAYEDKLLECFNAEEQEQFSTLISRLYSHAEQIEQK
ncbi:MarR family winged helix-turn-helix transcriptional regulator [Aliamphritea spongicola]|uniref:MarR family winged helix-turn-helix transcriptional regulator n=1 Tax=Aliamphritea spongicola TaxID=707589 RepID=UPI00196ACB0A|nr:MarR family transcriptional regulator [Aliamphritea spongicola]MBN3562733.1 MarR family transcriptional regulator [Aliamphritea spongicola]